MNRAGPGVWRWGEDGGGMTGLDASGWLIESPPAIESIERGASRKTGHARASGNVQAAKAPGVGEEGSWNSVTRVLTYSLVGSSSSPEILAGRAPDHGKPDS